MSQEHNPIAQLISKLQNSWNEALANNKEKKLVRWIIKSEEAKLYEGLLKLESSEHGRIPDMTVTLLNKFTSSTTHSKELSQDWINTFDNNTPEDFTWDTSVFEKRLPTEDGDRLLLDILSSFQKALPSENRFVTLCLYPYSITNIKDYTLWIERLHKMNNHKYVRLMIFDYQDQRFFDRLFSNQNKSTLSLEIPLDLDGAIDAISKSGDPNDPEYQLRHCIRKMTKYSAENNKKDLIKWGEKAISVGANSGEKITLATAYIVFASILFNFKDYKEIDQLLEQGLNISQLGLDLGDANCKSVIIQTIGFMASSKQMQKNNTEAIQLYQKQAETSIEYEFDQMALNSWWLASSLFKDKNSQQFIDLITTAYNTGAKLDKKLLKSSAMPYIAIEYYSYLLKENNKKESEKVDEFMMKLEGPNWKEKSTFNKKKLKEKAKTSIK